MNKNIYPWQVELWKQLREGAARRPHALLFHGQAGSGKTQFVRHFARSLLCEAALPDGHACETCASCLWFAQRSHPDFRLVRPEAIDVADGLEAADGEEVEAAEPAEKKPKRAPSKDIRIEQIRALASFLNIATHRGGQRVVVIYPAHAMNIYTANALLKMLEEPPPNTVFLLVAEGLERLLPTILSRCRKFAMAVPEAAVALPWLKEQGVEQAERLLAEQGGAPLAALDAARDGAELAQHRDRFLRLLADPARLDPMSGADSVAKIELPVVLGWMQRWLFDCMSHRLAGRIRYYPAHESRIALLSQALQPLRVLACLKTLNQERRIAEHPLSPKLFVENLLMTYAEALNDR